MAVHVHVCVHVSACMSASTCVCESFKKIQKGLIVFKYLNSLLLNIFFIWKASFLPDPSCILILIDLLFF